MFLSFTPPNDKRSKPVNGKFFSVILFLYIKDKALILSYKGFENSKEKLIIS
jgi:hypothetical protein